MKEVPVLESERLRLRAHKVSDYPDIAALWADPEVVRYISGVPSTSSESWSRLLRYAGMWQLIGYGYWLVESREDDRFLGEVGLADFRRGLHPAMDVNPEAGWVIRTCEAGKGYASEAVGRVMEWADDVAGFATTVCILNPDHVASIRVAHKSGFQGPTTVETGSDSLLLMQRQRKCGS